MSAPGFDLEYYRARVAALAARGMCVGTSSWKYDDWLGQIYTAARYEYRGKFAMRRFERDCLREYAVTLGLTVGPHPMRMIRELLPDAWPAGELKHGKPGARVQIAGAVSCRQRPGTAKGFVFITLEDETGHANAIVRPQLFEASRLVINVEPALVITGRLQNESGVIHVMSEKITALPAMGLPEQVIHDYH